MAAFAGPMVRIRSSPAESPCLTQTRPLQVENRRFRAGVRRSVDGARLLAAVARGGAYCFGGGGDGSRTGSGLILARIAFKVWMRGERK